MYKSKHEICTNRANLGNETLPRADCIFPWIRPLFSFYRRISHTCDTFHLLSILAEGVRWFHHKRHSSLHKLKRIWPLTWRFLQRRRPVSRFCQFLQKKQKSLFKKCFTENIYLVRSVQQPFQWKKLPQCLTHGWCVILQTCFRMHWHLRRIGD